MNPGTDLRTNLRTNLRTKPNTILKENLMQGVELLKKHEGFSGMPYKCTKGCNTIGYGTLLPLSEEEAEMLLRYRLSKVQRTLQDNISFYDDLPIEIRKVLGNMAYQMGVVGVLQFRKTLGYLQKREFYAAAIEMLDSEWSQQTPNRALELSAIVAKCSGM